MESLNHKKQHEDIMKTVDKQDMTGVFDDIRTRTSKQNIGTFLGDLTDHPEVLAKNILNLRKKKQINQSPQRN